jgi:hypothetical protein
MSRAAAKGPRRGPLSRTVTFASCHSAMAAGLVHVLWDVEDIEFFEKI